MTQDLVRVNPESIEQYGRAAQQSFDSIHQRLVGLVRDAVDVDYFGPNAVSFKTKCGELASDFATSFSKSLGAIAEAVRAQTTNISQALGGRPISISLDGSAIPLPPVPQGDGTVEMRTSGLTELMAKVGAHIGAVNEQLDSHLSKLQGTDWHGQAKDTATDIVSRYTAQAKKQAEEAQQAIAKFINEQIEAVQKADQ